MRRFPIVFLVMMAVSSVHAKKHELQITPADTFIVEDTEAWEVTIDRYRPLYYADVVVSPKDKSFSLKLFFKADLRFFMDHNRFDTPEAMKSIVINSSKEYLPGTVEKSIEVEEISNKGWYGFKTTLTDAEWVGKPIPKGEFLYLTRGMIRLSEPKRGSALGFSLMTNDVKSPETKKIMDYIYGFAKERTAAPDAAPPPQDKPNTAKENP